MHIADRNRDGPQKMDVINKIKDGLSRILAVPGIWRHGDLLKKRAEAMDRGNDRFMALTKRPEFDA